jgi:DHA3 family macrolide efflux protein-like MFS transporter
MKTVINKNYTKLLTATFVTRFGDSIDSIAFSWLVYVMTGSRVLMGSIFAISMLPNLIVMPFAGVIADTFNKKIIVVIGDILRAISVATLALFYFFNILEVWHLFVFVSVNSLFESFANPARKSMLPSIIEEKDYLKGSSWLGTSSNVGEVIGLAVAGILIATVGIWGTILIDALTFMISALLIIFIAFKDRRNEVKIKPKVKDYFILIGQGIAYLKQKKILLSFLILAAFVNFSLVPISVLKPIYVVEVLHMGVEGLSYLGISFLLGMVVGGYLIGARFKNVNPINAIGLGLCLQGVMYILLVVPAYVNFGQLYSFIFVIIVTFIFGSAFPLVNAPMQSIIMKTTEPGMLGRLSSIMGVILLSAMPLGGVFVSVIGEKLPVSLLFIIMGISGIILSSLFWFKNRYETLS